jgi:diamine N-acetyltransferase
VTGPAPEPALTLRGDRVALGPLRRELYPLHVGWVNDPEVGSNVFGGPQERSLEEEGAWLDAENAKPDSAFFLIYHREDDDWRPIGVTSLTEIDPEAGRATFRILIGAAADRGRGLGQAAARLVLDHAFGKLGLETIALHVFDFNVAARRLYQALGFREVRRGARRPFPGGRLGRTIIMELRSAATEQSRSSSPAAHDVDREGPIEEGGDPIDLGR